MPIQDTFIGNLRAARGIQNGLNITSRSMAQPRVPTTPTANTAPMLEPRTVEQDTRAKNGMRYVEEPKVAENSTFEASTPTALPKTEQDWKNFMDGLDGFYTLLDEYENEPNQDRRIALIEKNAPAFKDSRKLARYLYIMHEDELANKNGDYDDFDYRFVKPGVRDAINSVLSYRMKRA